MSDSSGESSVDRLVSELFKALEVSDESQSSGLNLEFVMAEVRSLGAENFSRVGFDLSLLVGVSGDWRLALEFANRLEEVGGSFPEELLKVWQLKCLVELERFSEALAIVRSKNWSASSQIHVNYLSALAFEALGMHQESRLRFDAVNRKNPNYRDVALRLLKD